MVIPREVKVGVFVFLGCLVAGALIFIIGDNKMLFEEKADYRVRFEDVQGLKPGSTVRMGGVDIGNVSSVSYPADPSSNLIDVVLSITEREAGRIRIDSEASIAGKGLLGDKLVSITAGSPDQPVAPPGSVLRAAPSEDLTQLMGRVEQMSVKADRALTNVELLTRVLADQQVQDDIKGGVGALRNILESLDRGQGYAARVLHDPAEADRMSRLMANLERTTSELEGVLAGVRQAIERVNTGPGLAHELVYGERGAQAVAQIGNAAEEVGATLAGVRNGKGVARDLLFGSEGDGDPRVANNLAAMTDDLRAIVGDMRQGKGTLGALLVDPSVYEDLKLLLGNVQRNQTLRALVRYSIKKDGASAPEVEVVDPGVAEQRPPRSRAEPRGSSSSASRR